MKKIVLAGNAISADIINAYLKQDSRYNVLAATVDDEYVEAGSVEGLPSVGLSRLKDSFPATDVSIIMAMGYGNLNQVRESMYHRLKEMGYTIETYIHPDAKVYSEHPVGEGSVILPNAVIEPHVRVGNNCAVWCNVTLAHHCIVEPNCWVASGAVVSGQATIKRNCFIGVNATIVNKVVVAEYNIIGGGALITKDTKPSTVHLARSGEEIRYSSQDYVKYIGV